MSTLSVRVAHAQYNEALSKSFETVSAQLLRAAEMVPEDRYQVQPVASVRTFLQLIAHVADGNVYYCRTASGRKVEWDDPIERSARTKGEALAALRESIATCGEVYREANASADALVDNLAHANLHYGNVITYLRIMGLTPPSS